MWRGAWQGDRKPAVWCCSTRSRDLQLGGGSLAGGGASCMRDSRTSRGASGSHGRVTVRIEPGVDRRYDAASSYSVASDAESRLTPSFAVASTDCSEPLMRSTIA